MADTLVEIHNTTCRFPHRREPDKRISFSEIRGIYPSAERDGAMGHAACNLKNEQHNQSPKRARASNAQPAPTTNIK